MFEDWYKKYLHISCQWVVKILTAAGLENDFGNQQDPLNVQRWISD